MSDVNWGCCPLVAQTPIVRAFIERPAKERKAQSIIENYSRDRAGEFARGARQGLQKHCKPLIAFMFSASWQKWSRKSLELIGNL